MKTWNVMLVVAFAGGCSASSQKPAVAQALRNDELRAESFEATLRVLDEHPEYVDELFRATLRHPRTLNRFIANTASNLHDDELARLTAWHLTRHPESLRQTMIASLDESSDQPAALDAVARAMTARPQVSAMAITQREQALRTTMAALVDEVMKNAPARAAFLAAIQENSPEMAELIANNPEVLKALLKAFAEVGVQDGGEELRALIEALGDTER